MAMMVSPDGREQMDVPDSLVAHYQSKGAQLVGASGSRVAQAPQVKASGPTQASGPGGFGGAMINALPAAGGLIGGLGGGAVGGAFGMGLGLPEGVALGSGLGGAAGEAARETILRSLGYSAPASSSEAARNILGSGVISAGTTYAPAKALQIGGKVLGAAGVHPAIQQAIKSLGGRLMRFGGLGEAGAEVAERAAGNEAQAAVRTVANEANAPAQAATRTVGDQGSSVQKFAQELTPAEEKTAAGQAAQKTVKPGARGARGKPLPGSAESRIKLVPKNAGQAGKSTPALIRQGAANADDLAGQLQKSLEFESEMAHRGLTPEERAIARKLMARGVNPFEEAAQ